MRTLTRIFSFLIILSITGCRSGTGNQASADIEDTGEAVLVFQEYEHNFGKVGEGEKISYQFKYENRGTGSLAITSVTTSCGCTVPKYNTKPVKPGERGNLEVVFDTSGRNGMQTKTITVRSNATVPVVLLKITAEVEQN
jgi:hypothetical protein